MTRAAYLALARRLGAGSPTAERIAAAVAEADLYSGRPPLPQPWPAPVPIPCSVLVALDGAVASAVP